ncbi:hypothetical protein RI367_008125 [Sorochytrium milnesiophthora]
MSTAGLNQTPDEIDDRATATDNQDAATEAAQEAAVQEEEDELLTSGIFDVEQSTAFKILDSLRAQNKITAERRDELKQCYHAMYKHILTAFEYERFMSKKTRALQADVAKQKLEIDKTGTKAFDDNAEIGELKRELLRYQNEVALTQDREAKRQAEMNSLLRVKDGLLDDIEEIRRHKADMLEPQLIAATKELRLDVLQRKHQVENLEKDYYEKQTVYEHSLKEKERLLSEKEKLEVSLAKADELPTKILKQAEVLRDAIASLVIETGKQATVATQLDKDVDRLAKKRKDLEDEKLSLATDYEAKRQDMQELERKCDSMYHEHEQSKETLKHQEAEKAKTEQALKTTIREIKNAHDSAVRYGRENETQLKAYRRLESMVNNIVSTTPALERQADNVKLQKALAERDSKHYKTTLKNLRQEIDVLIHSFLEGEKLEVKQKELVAARLDGNRRIEAELAVNNEKVDQLMRSVQTLKDEREMKAREVLRLSSKLRKLKDSVIAKDIEEVDAGKRSQEAVTRLREFAVLYDTVKNERNRYMNMIQSSQQRVMEMKEKTRILQSELEILRAEQSRTDKDLQRKRQENNSLYAKRDNARMESNRSLAQYREKRSQIDQNVNRIETLSNHLAAVSNELQMIKVRYESAVGERNAIGLQLLDRNDELCILYEKSNVQEKVSTTGEEQLVELDETVRHLKLAKSELGRSIEVKKRVAPGVKKMEAELAQLQEKLRDARAKAIELSAFVESPSESRTRYLPGSDPAQKDLVARVRKLEEKLAVREEKLLEKDLILEEIAQLTERLKKQTTEGRTESSDTINKANELNRKIRSIAKTTMSKLSELSMTQAQVASLQEERQRKETFFNRLQTALLEDDFYVEEFEAEFQRQEAVRQRRLQQTRKNVPAHEGDWTVVPEADIPTYLLPNGTRTVAEPRPNAYLPTAESDLQVPKPYGKFAPYKPQELMGGNLPKYYKKMVTKPIEI